MKRQAACRQSRVLMDAIKTEASVYGGVVEFFQKGKHPQFKVTFPNGQSRKHIFSSSPNNLDNHVSHCRQHVRLLASKVGAKPR